jgi:hypothetical protein
MPDPGVAMRRTLATSSALLALLALSQGFAAAQADRRVELFAGIQYPLVAQEFQVEQSTGFNAGVLFAVTSRFQLGGLYESYGLEDDLGRSGDADLTLYGVTGSFYLNDDPEFRILALASAGIGELEYDNPGEPDPELVDSTDISRWYEAGVGVQFRSGERWNFRLKLGFRQVKPDEKSILLDGTRSMLVPAAQVGVRF